MRLPTRQIVLEGCDLSGKSTFYGQFHKFTGFGYDIRDRGHISRAVYPKIFGRDNSHESGELHRFLDDMNNVVVFLAPEWSTVAARFAARGDEMHDLGSLRITWEEFNTQSLALQNHPSVFVCRTIPDPESIRDIVCSRENVTTDRISNYVEMSLRSTGRNESTDTCFDLIVDPKDDPGPSSLAVKGEEEYYSQIYNDLISRITREISEGQTSESRRFVTTNSSCMSYFRFLHRSDQDVVDLVFRSTNVPKNLKIDLDAAIHMGFQAQMRANLPIRKIVLRVKLHCAHIIP